MKTPIINGGGSLEVSQQASSSAASRARRKVRRTNERWWDNQDNYEADGNEQGD